MVLVIGAAQAAAKSAAPTPSPDALALASSWPASRRKTLRARRIEVALGTLLDAKRTETCLRTIAEGGWPASWLVVSARRNSDLVLRIALAADGSIADPDTAFSPRAATGRRVVRNRLPRRDGKHRAREATQRRDPVVHPARRHRLRLRPPRDGQSGQGALALLPEGSLIREAQAVDLRDGSATRWRSCFCVRSSCRRTAPRRRDASRDTAIRAASSSRSREKPRSRTSSTSPTSCDRRRETTPPAVRLRGGRYGAGRSTPWSTTSSKEEPVRLLDLSALSRRADRRPSRDRRHQARRKRVQALRVGALGTLVLNSSHSCAGSVARDTYRCLHSRGEVPMEISPVIARYLRYANEPTHRPRGRARARGACQKRGRRRRRRLCASIAFVIRVAMEFRNRGVPLEDLINEGCLGLLGRSALRSRNGARFMTCTSFWVRQAVLDTLADQPLLVRMPLTSASDGSLCRGVRLDAPIEAGSDRTFGDGLADARVPSPGASMSDGNDCPAAEACGRCPRENDRCWRPGRAARRARDDPDGSRIPAGDLASVCGRSKAPRFHACDAPDSGSRVGRLLVRAEPQVDAEADEEERADELRDRLVVVEGRFYEVLPVPGEEA